MTEINTINTRFQNYKTINNFLNKNVINSTNGCLIHSNEPNNYLYSFNNNIFLIKRIGINSSDATIFLTEIKISKKKYKLVTKIQLFKNLIEYDFLNKTTEYAIKNKNIHLPLVYSFLKCNKFNKLDTLLPRKIINHKKIKSDSYYSIFAELASGDIITYTKDIVISSNYLYNAFAQCFISILACHNAGIFHRDSHAGNFLYHKIHPGGCIQYKYKNLVFYIENIGYNWVIWDFGRSTTISFINKLYIYNDFIVYLESLFIDSPAYNLLSIITKENTDFIYNLLDIIETMKDDYLIISELIKKNLLFLNKPVGKILMTVNLY
jgi:serine/threonine protein kinase